MKAFFVTKLCDTTLRPDGEMFMTGTSFTVYTQNVRRGQVEREVTRIYDGNHNDGGWFVEGTLDEVAEIIMRGED
jgi:hypothetical protein